MKKTLITFFLLGWMGALMAQTIQRIEYFFDTDPGFGTGVLVPFSGTNIATANLSIPLNSGLSDGLHRFFIRAKDSNGRWSIGQSQNFFKISIGNIPSNIVNLEYFIDTDPGYGLGNALAITNGPSVTKDLSIPLPQNLPIGFHKIYVRAKDISRNWSLVFHQNFFKTEIPPTVPNLVKLEYFVDTDPGFGLATDFPISVNTLVNIDEPIFQLAPSLLGGNHTLYLRAKDALGKWSMVAQKAFTNCEIGATVSANPSNASCGTPITLNVGFQNNNSSILNWTWFKNGIEIANSANVNTIQATNTANFFVKLVTTGNGACNTTNSNIFPIFIKTADSVRIKTNANSTNCNNPALLEVDTQNSFITSGLGVIYTWFRNNAAISNSNAPTLSVTQGGIYKVRINYLGGLADCGIIESNGIQIQDKNPFVAISPVSALPDKIVVCSGSSIQLNALSDLAGTLTYQWFKDNVELNGQTNATLLVNNTPGNYKVNVSGGGCTGLASSNYILSYSGSVSGSPVMNLTSGSLSSCPGNLATLSVSGCGGIVEWNNGFEGSTLSVTQLNSSFTYQAICRTTCMQTVATPNTFIPSGATLPSPIIGVDDLPVSNSYSVISSRTHGNAFRYNNFSYAEAVAPVEGGNNYYISQWFEFNAFDKSHNLVFGQVGVQVGIPAANVKGKDIILLKNNHFLMAGISDAGIIGDKSIASFGGNDFWVLSRNILGSKLWDKAFGGSGADNLSKVIQLSDGNLILAGTSASAIGGNKTAALHGNNDFWVVKTDSLGNKLADFSYGGSSNEVLNDALFLSNGNILLLGSSDSGISGNKTSAAIGSGDFWAVVIDANGVKIWDKTFGTANAEYGTSAVEKNNNIYMSVFKTAINFDNDEILKVNLSGDIIQSNAYPINSYQFSAISSSFKIKKIQKSPTGDLVLTGRVSGNAAIGNIQYGYDYLVMVEIQEDLNLINSTKTTFGSTLGDDLGATFFDKEGNFHLIKSNNIFNCPESNDPNFALYYLDGSAQNTTLCNRGNITDGHWFKWTVSKYNFQNRSYSDFCKGKEFLLKASIPNQENLRNIQFNWSDGQTGQIIKITPQTRLPLYVSYSQNGVSNVCGSTVAYVNLYPYGDKLVLAGNNFTDVSSKFAYKEISSSENLGISANYRSEGNITLSPGFQISGNATKVFKAEVGGCLN